MSAESQSPPSGTGDAGKQQLQQQTMDEQQQPQVSIVVEFT
jgi:hypothetical protein